MKKIKNKFIITIIVLISILLSYWTYLSFIKTNIDRNSYIVLITGEAYLNWNKLKLEKKEKLNSSTEKKDKIKTIWKDSLAIIEWWDWSLTRVWWNSELEVFEHNIDKNLAKINISFKLLKWKTWSNVISFIWDWSYFNQYFADKNAAVRGTIFEVNLEKSYLYVDKHEVKITDSHWKEKIIKEKTPFDIKNFSFLSLEEFILEIKDKTWEELNKKLDIEFFNKLKENLEKNLDIIIKKANEDIWDITNLTEEKRKHAYDEVLKNYQKINFISSEDKEIFKIKNSYRSNLIDLSSTTNNKKSLVLNTLYDFKDSISNKNYSWLKENLKILWENKNLLKELDIDFNNYFDVNIFKQINSLPSDLKDSFDDFIYDLDLEFEARSFINNIENSVNNLDIDSIWTKARDFINGNIK